MKSNNNLESTSASSTTQAWQGFTFFSDSSEQITSRYEESYVPGSDVFPLSEAQLGSRLLLIDLQPLDSINCLRKMGFVPGAELQVISCTGSGSVIVVVQNKSLGIGANIAQCILVTKMPILNSED